MRAIDDQMHERLFDIVTVSSINYYATGIIFKDERQWKSLYRRSGLPIAATLPGGIK